MLKVLQIQWDCVLEFHMNIIEVVLGRGSVRSDGCIWSTPLKMIYYHLNILKDIFLLFSSEEIRLLRLFPFIKIKIIFSSAQHIQIILYRCFMGDLHPRR